MEWEYVPYDDTPLEGAMVLLGMPSASAVGAVAAGVLAEQLRMRVIGGFQSPELPPISVIRDGHATSPVQAWATEMACGLDGRCDRLVIVKGDLPLPTESLMPLADAVARWGVQGKVALVAALEAFPEEGFPREGLAMASSVAGAAAAGRIGATPLPQGVLAGFNAALLLRANRHGLPAVALFAPSPDARRVGGAVATLLGRLDPLVPNIPLAGDQMAKQAEALVARFEDEQRQRAKAERKLQDHVERSYA